MKIYTGMKVATPRFGVVTIAEAFGSVSEAKTHNYTEPTHYQGDMIILGKSIGINRMVFAAVPNTEGGAGYE